MSNPEGYYPDGPNFPPPPPAPAPAPGQGHYAGGPDGHTTHGVGNPPPPRGPPSPRDPRASFDSGSYFRAAPGRRPSEPHIHDDNVLTPYDNEKAYAEYTDAYGPPPSSSTYGSAAGRGPPPADHHRGYPDEPRRAEPRDRFDPESDTSYYDSRHPDNRGWDDRPPPPSDMNDRHRAFDSRDRYDSRDSYDSRDRYAASSPPRARQGGKKDKDVFRQGLGGERGLASAVLGAAAGAWIGHEAGRGALGTLSGMAVGAIGGSAIEKQAESYKEKKRREKEGRRRRDSDLDSRYPSRSVVREASPSRRRRDSRATSWDSGPRRRYSVSPDSYAGDRR